MKKKNKLVRYAHVSLMRMFRNKPLRKTLAAWCAFATLATTCSPAFAAAQTGDYFEGAANLNRTSTGVENFGTIDSTHAGFTAGGGTGVLDWNKLNVPGGAELAFKNGTFYNVVNSAGGMSTIAGMISGTDGANVSIFNPNGVVMANGSSISVAGIFGAFSMGMSEANLNSWIANPTMANPVFEQGTGAIKAEGNASIAASAINLVGASVKTEGGTTFTGPTKLAAGDVIQIDSVAGGAVSFVIPAAASAGDIDMLGAFTDALEAKAAGDIVIAGGSLTVGGDLTAATAGDPDVAPGDIILNNATVSANGKNVTLVAAGGASILGETAIGADKVSVTAVDGDITVLGKNDGAAAVEINATTKAAFTAANGAVILGKEADDQQVVVDTAALDITAKEAKLYNQTQQGGAITADKVTLQGSMTQAADAKLVTGELALDNAAKDGAFALKGSANEIASVGGAAKSLDLVTKEVSFKATETKDGLAVETKGGAIAQTGAIKAGGNVTLKATKGIALENADNEFAGKLALTAAGDVSVKAKSDIALSAATHEIGGDLTLAGTGDKDITIADATVNVGGDLTLKTSGNPVLRLGDINIDNAAITAAGEVSGTAEGEVNVLGGTTLKGANVTLIAKDGNLEVLGAVGGAAKTTVKATATDGAVTLNAQNGEVVLGNEAFDMRAAAEGAKLNIAAEAATLVNQVQQGGAITADKVTLQGSMTQDKSAKLVTDELVIDNAAKDGAFALKGSANEIATASGAAKSIELVTKTVDLGATETKETLAVNAINGSISQSGMLKVGEKATFAAKGDITLADTANVFGDKVDVTTTAGDATIANNADLHLDQVSVGGAFTASAKGNLTVKNGASVIAKNDLGLTATKTIMVNGDVGGATVKSTAGSVTLTADNDVLLSDDATLSAKKTLTAHAKNTYTDLGVVVEDVTVEAGEKIVLTADDGDIELNGTGKVDSKGTVVMTAENGSILEEEGAAIVAKGAATLSAKTVDAASSVNDFKGLVNAEATADHVTIRDANDISLGTVSAVKQATVFAGTGAVKAGDSADVKAENILLKGEAGNVEVSGAAKVVANKNVTLVADSDVKVQGANPVKASDGSVYVKAGNDILLGAGEVVKAQGEDGNVLLDAARDIKGVGATSGQVTALGPNGGDGVVMVIAGRTAGDNVSFNANQVSAGAQGGGDVTLNVTGDMNLTLDVGDHDITVNHAAGTLTIAKGSVSADTVVNEVKEDKTIEEHKLSDLGAVADGVLGKDVTITGTDSSYLRVNADAVLQADGVASIAVDKTVTLLGSVILNGGGLISGYEGVADAAGAAIYTDNDFTFKAEGGTVALKSTGNFFENTVSVTAKSIDLEVFNPDENKNTILLGKITQTDAAGTLSVKATGNIREESSSGKIKTAGVASFDSTEGSVHLYSRANDFGDLVNATAGDSVTISAGEDVEFGVVSAAYDVSVYGEKNVIVMGSDHKLEAADGDVRIKAGRAEIEGEGTLVIDDGAKVTATDGIRVEAYEGINIYDGAEVAADGVVRLETGLGVIEIDKASVTAGAGIWGNANDSFIVRGGAKVTAGGNLELEATEGDVIIRGAGTEVKGADEVIVNSVNANAKLTGGAKLVGEGSLTAIGAGSGGTAGGKVTIEDDAQIVGRDSVMVYARTTAKIADGALVQVKGKTENIEANIGELTIQAKDVVIDDATVQGGVFTADPTTGAILTRTSNGNVTFEAETVTIRNGATVVADRNVTFDAKDTVIKNAGSRVLADLDVSFVYDNTDLGTAKIEDSAYVGANKNVKFGGFGDHANVAVDVDGATVAAKQYVLAEAESMTIENGAKVAADALVDIETTGDLTIKSGAELLSREALSSDGSGNLVVKDDGTRVQGETIDLSADGDITFSDKAKIIATGTEADDGVMIMAGDGDTTVDNASIEGNRVTVASGYGDVIVKNGAYVKGGVMTALGGGTDGDATAGGVLVDNATVAADEFALLFAPVGSIVLKNSARVQGENIRVNGNDVQVLATAAVSASKNATLDATVDATVKGRVETADGSVYVKAGQDVLLGKDEVIYAEGTDGHVLLESGRDIKGVDATTRASVVARGPNGDDGRVAFVAGGNAGEQIAVTADKVYTKLTGTGEATLTLVGDNNLSLDAGDKDVTIAHSDGTLTIVRGGEAAGGAKVNEVAFYGDGAVLVPHYLADAGGAAEGLTAHDITINGENSDLGQASDAKVHAKGETTLVIDGDITLDGAANDFVGNVNAKAENIKLTDADTIILGKIDQTDASGTLEVTAADKVGEATGTDGKIKTAGVANFTATDGDVIVDNANNAFGALVNADAANVTIGAGEDLEIGVVTAANAANVNGQKNVILRGSDYEIKATDGSVVIKAGLANGQGEGTLIVDDGAKITASANIEAKAYEGVNIYDGAEVAADGNVKLETTLGVIEIDNARVTAKGGVNVSAGDDILIRGTKAVVKAGDIDETTPAFGTAEGDVKLMAVGGSVTIKSGAKVGANGKANVYAKKNVKIDKATLVANKQMTLDADDAVTVKNNAYVAGNDKLTIGGVSILDEVTVDNATIEAKKNVEVSGNDVVIQNNAKVGSSLNTYVYAKHDITVESGAKVLADQSSDHVAQLWAKNNVVVQGENTLVKGDRTMVYGAKNATVQDKATVMSTSTTVGDGATVVSSANGLTLVDNATVEAASSMEISSRYSDVTVKNGALVKGDVVQVGAGFDNSSPHGDILIDNATVQGNSYIQLYAPHGAATVQNGAEVLVNGSLTGNPTIDIVAKDVLVDNAKIKSGEFDETTGEPGSKFGTILIDQAQSVTLQNSAKVGANGAVAVFAKDTLVKDAGTQFASVGGLYLNTLTDGAGTLTVKDGAYVASRKAITVGGDAKATEVTIDNATVEAKQGVTLNADGMTTLKGGAKVGAGTSGLADADVVLNVDKLTMNDATLIASRNIDVNADGAITVDGANARFKAGSFVTIDGKDAVEIKRIGSVEAANARIANEGAAEGKDVTIGGDVTADGNITVIAKHSVNQNANLTAKNGSVYVEAVDGGIALAKDVVTSASGSKDPDVNGNILYKTKTGDIEGDAAGFATLKSEQGLVKLESETGKIGKSIKAVAKGFLGETTGEGSTVYGTLVGDVSVAYKTPGNVEITHENGTLTIADVSFLGDLWINKVLADLTADPNPASVVLQTAADASKGVKAGGNLSIIGVNDYITQDAHAVIDVAGVTTLKSTKGATAIEVGGIDRNGDIDFFAENDFGGKVHATAENITLKDKNSIQLGAVAAAKALDVSAADIVANEGASVTAGLTADFTATRNIIVNGSSTITADGDLTASAGHAVTINGELDGATPTSVKSTTGDLLLKGGESVNVYDGATVVADLGDVKLHSLEDASVTGIKIDGGIVKAENGTATLEADIGNVEVNASEENYGLVRAGKVVVTAKDGDINILGSSKIAASDTMDMTAAKGFIQEDGTAVLEAGAKATFVAQNVLLYGELNDFMDEVFAQATDGTVIIMDKNDIIVDQVTATATAGIGAGENLFVQGSDKKVAAESVILYAGMNKSEGAGTVVVDDGAQVTAENTAQIMAYEGVNVYDGAKVTAKGTDNSSIMISAMRGIAEVDDATVESVNGGISISSGDGVLIRGAEAKVVAAKGIGLGAENDIDIRDQALVNGKGGVYAEAENITVDNALVKAGDFEVAADGSLVSANQRGNLGLQAGDAVTIKNGAKVIANGTENSVAGAKSVTVDDATLAVAGSKSGTTPVADSTLAIDAGESVSIENNAYVGARGEIMIGADTTPANLTVDDAQLVAVGELMAEAGEIVIRNDAKVASDDMTILNAQESDITISGAAKVYAENGIGLSASRDILIRDAGTLVKGGYAEFAAGEGGDDGSLKIFDAATVTIGSELLAYALDNVEIFDSAVVTVAGAGTDPDTDIALTLIAENGSVRIDGDRTGAATVTAGTDTQAANLKIEAGEGVLIASGANVEATRDISITAQDTITDQGVTIRDENTLVAAGRNATIESYDDVTIEKSALVKAGEVDEVTPAFGMKEGNLKLVADVGSVTVESGAQVGANGTVDIDAKEEVTVDNATLVANKAMTIDAEDAVTVENSAYVAGNDTLTIGGTTIPDEVTVDNATVEAKQNVKIVGNDVVIQNNAKVGSSLNTIVYAKHDITVESGAKVLADKSGDHIADLEAENNIVVQGENTLVEGDRAQVFGIENATVQDKATVNSTSTTEDGGAATVVSSDNGLTLVDNATVAAAYGTEISSHYSDVTIKNGALVKGEGVQVGAGFEDTATKGDVLVDNATVQGNSYVLLYAPKGSATVKNGAEVLMNGLSSPGQVLEIVAKDVLVDNAKIKAGAFDETTGELGSKFGAIAFYDAESVTLQNSAKVGANGLVIVNAKDTLIKDTGTQLAAGGELYHDTLTDGAGTVTVKDGAYVASKKTITVGGTAKANELTIDNATVEAKQGVTLNADGMTTLKGGAKVGAGTSGLVDADVVLNVDKLTMNDATMIASRNVDVNASGKILVNSDAAQFTAGSFVTIDGKDEVEIVAAAPMSAENVRIANEGAAAGKAVTIGGDVEAAGNLTVIAKGDVKQNADMKAGKTVYVYTDAGNIKLGTKGEGAAKRGVRTESTGLLADNANVVYETGSGSITGTEGYDATLITKTDGDGGVVVLRSGSGTIGENIQVETPVLLAQTSAGTIGGHLYGDVTVAYSTTGDGKVEVKHSDGTLTIGSADVEGGIKANKVLSAPIDGTAGNPEVVLVEPKTAGGAASKGIKTESGSVSIIGTNDRIVQTDDAVIEAGGVVKLQATKGTMEILDENGKHAEGSIVLANAGNDFGTRLDIKTGVEAGSAIEAGEDFAAQRQGTVEIADKNSITLGEVTTLGNLKVTAKTKNVEQTADSVITVGTADNIKSATFVAEKGNVTLANNGNDFSGKVNAYALTDGDITIRDANDVNLGEIRAESGKATVYALTGDVLGDRRADVLAKNVELNAEAKDVVLSDAAKVKGSDLVVLQGQKNVRVTDDGTKVESPKEVRIVAKTMDALVEKKALVRSDKTVSLTAKENNVIVKESGYVTANTVTLTAEKKTVEVTTSGKVEGNQVKLDAKSGADGLVTVNNNGIVEAVGAGALVTLESAKKAEVTSGGTVRSNDKVDITAPTVLADGGTIQAVNDVTLEASDLVQLQGGATVKSTAKNVVVNTTDFEMYKGTVDAAKNVDINASGEIFVNDSSASFKAGDYLWLDALGSVLIQSVAKMDAANVRIANEGAADAKDVTISGDVTASGNLTIIAKGSVEQNANLKAENGSVYVAAKTGHIALNTTASGEGVKTEAYGGYKRPDQGVNGNVLYETFTDAGWIKGKDLDHKATMYSDEGVVALKAQGGEIGDNIKVTSKLLLGLSSGTIRGALEGDIHVAYNTEGDVDITHENGKLTIADASTFGDVYANKVETTETTTEVEIQTAANATHGITAENVTIKGKNDTITQDIAGELGATTSASIDAKDVTTLESSGTIDLRSTENNFRGTVNAKSTAGGDITLVGKNTINLDNVQANVLNVTAVAGDAEGYAGKGNITDVDGSGADKIVVAGTANLTAKNDIVLDSANNDFQAKVNAKATDGNLTIRDSGDIHLGVIRAESTADGKGMVTIKSVNGTVMADTTLGTGKPGDVVADVLAKNVVLVGEEGAAGVEISDDAKIKSTEDVKIDTAGKIVVDGAAAKLEAGRDILAAAGGDIELTEAARIYAERNLRFANEGADGKTITIGRNIGVGEDKVGIEAGNNLSIVAQGGVKQNGNLTADIGSVLIQSITGGILLGPDIVTTARNTGAVADNNGNVLYLAGSDNRVMDGDIIGAVGGAMPFVRALNDGYVGLEAKGRVSGIRIDGNTVSAKTEGDIVLDLIGDINVSYSTISGNIDIDHSDGTMTVVRGKEGSDVWANKVLADNSDPDNLVKELIMSSTKEGKGLVAAGDPLLGQGNVTIRGKNDAVVINSVIEADGGNITITTTAGGNRDGSITVNNDYDPAKAQKDQTGSSPYEYALRADKGTITLTSNKTADQADGKVSFSYEKADLVLDQNMTINAKEVTMTAKQGDLVVRDNARVATTTFNAKEVKLVAEKGDVLVKDDADLTLNANHVSEDDGAYLLLNAKEGDVAITTSGDINVLDAGTEGLVRDLPDPDDTTKVSQHAKLKVLADNGAVSFGKSAKETGSTAVRMGKVYADGHIIVDADKDIYVNAEEFTAGRNIHISNQMESDAAPLGEGEGNDVLVESKLLAGKTSPLSPDVDPSDPDDAYSMIDGNMTIKASKNVLINSDLETMGGTIYMQAAREGDQNVGSIYLGANDDPENPNTIISRGVDGNIYMIAEADDANIIGAYIDSKTWKAYELEGDYAGMTPVSLQAWGESFDDPDTGEFFGSYNGWVNMQTTGSAGSDMDIIGAHAGVKSKGSVKMKIKGDVVLSIQAAGDIQVTHKGETGSITIPDGRSSYGVGNANEILSDFRDEITPDGGAARTAIDGELAPGGHEMKDTGKGWSAGHDIIVNAAGDIDIHVDGQMEAGNDVKINIGGDLDTKPEGYIGFGNELDLYADHLKAPVNLIPGKKIDVRVNDKAVAFETLSGHTHPEVIINPFLNYVLVDGRITGGDSARRAEMYAYEDSAAEGIVRLTSVFNYAANLFPLSEFTDVQDQAAALTQGYMTSDKGEIEEVENEESEGDVSETAEVDDGESEEETAAADEADTEAPKVAKN